MFPKTSNNVRFPTKTSQLSITKRDECNRRVGCVSLSVTILYEHHKHSKVVLPNVIFGQIKTTNYDLSIHNRSTLKLVRPQTNLVASSNPRWSVKDVSEPCLRAENGRRSKKIDGPAVPYPPTGHLRDLQVCQLCREASNIA